MSGRAALPRGRNPIPRPARHAQGEGGAICHNKSPKTKKRLGRPHPTRLPPCPRHLPRSICYHIPRSSKSTHGPHQKRKRQFKRLLRHHRPWPSRRHAQRTRLVGRRGHENPRASRAVEEHARHLFQRQRSQPDQRGRPSSKRPLARQEIPALGRRSPRALHRPLAGTHRPRHHLGRPRLPRRSRRHRCRRGRRKASGWRRAGQLQPAAHPPRPAEADEARHPAPWGGAKSEL